MDLIGFVGAAANLPDYKLLNIIYMVLTEVDACINFGFLLICCSLSCGQVLKSIKSTRGQICPMLLRRKGPFHVDWRTTMHTNGF